MYTLKPIRLSELKTQATFLLKEVRSNSFHSHTSAKRFLQLSCFAGKNLQWLCEQADTIQLKHAYQVLAHENGFAAWADLKKYVVEKDCLYKSSCVGFIHAWFSDYQRAEAYHLKHGGYLLTFWDDYVVCGKEYVEHIGLATYQKQWERTGYDWARPKNKEAWNFLNETAKLNYVNQQ